MAVWVCDKTPAGSLKILNKDFIWEKKKGEKLNSSGRGEPAPAATVAFPAPSWWGESHSPALLSAPGPVAAI